MIRDRISGKYAVIIVFTVFLLATRGFVDVVVPKILRPDGRLDLAQPLLGSCGEVLEQALRNINKF